MGKRGRRFSRLRCGPEEPGSAPQCPMITTSSPPRQKVAVGRLGQRQEHPEEKATTVNAIPPHQKHRQLQLHLESHIGSNGEKSQAAPYHSAEAPIRHFTGAEPRKAPPQKHPENSQPQKPPGSSWEGQARAQRSWGLGCIAAGAQKAGEMQPLRAHKPTASRHLLLFPSPSRAGIFLPIHSSIMKEKGGGLIPEMFCLSYCPGSSSGVKETQVPQNSHFLKH